MKALLIYGAAAEHEKKDENKGNNISVQLLLIPVVR